MLGISRTRVCTLAAVLAATATTASAQPPVATIDSSASSGAAAPLATTVALVRLARALDLPSLPDSLTAALVHCQLGARDLVHHAAAISDAAVRLFAVVEPFGSLTLPHADLTVLTTSPIASMRPDESSGFGWRDDPVSHRDRRFHRGTDFRAKPGTPVLVAGDGVVVFAGQQSGYGNVIYINHGGGVVTRYAHLSRIEAKKDAIVAAGTEIGKVGSTGRVTGPHLHYEIRLDGNAVDLVLGMSVAELERDAPAAGALAAYSLAPELQATKLDGEDNTNRARAKSGTSVSTPPSSRPARPGYVKQTQVLW